MSMSRGDLIEYLCGQQHAARLAGLLAAGRSVNGCPFSALRDVEKSVDRAAMSAVLDELADLGLLRELHAKTPAT